MRDERRDEPVEIVDGLRPRQHEVCGQQIGRGRQHRGDHTRGRSIQQRVVDQAQAEVNSDLEAARVIYQHQLERLEDALRIHAKRSVIYGPLAERRTAGLDLELEGILDGEKLDLLTLTDASGEVFHRAGNPGAPDRLVSVGLHAAS